MKRFSVILLALFTYLTATAQIKKYTNHNEFSVVTYGPIFLESGFALHTFHGLNLNEKFAIGLNTGLDRYPVDDNGEKWFLPLSTKINYVEYPKRKRSFFAGIDLGYGFAFLNKTFQTNNLKSKYRGGVLFSPQLGWRFKFKDSQSYWSLATGYRYQQFNREDSYSAPASSLPNVDNGYGLIHNETRYHLHRFTLQVGIGF
ncbi:MULTISPECIES: hypothetical protein [unclassified Sphingobacterium]|uniref:hypothetical protein n=1 Tax=unclassified Sphingobacterium TaxID=2609468 RepID=UPI0025FD9810|nr:MULTISPECIES: hypothetical protein [unclassified Sphingobacterium]